MISSGWDRGTEATAMITAAISPIWFDWVGPGTQMDEFDGLSWLTHTLLPQVAFLFPLFRHAPSV